MVTARAAVDVEAGTAVGAAVGALVSAGRRVGIGAVGIVLPPHEETNIDTDNTDIRNAKRFTWFSGFCMV
jgi:hypothetical protein